MEKPEKPLLVMPDRDEHPIRGTDLEFPPHVFEGAEPEDVPILEKVAMTLSASCSKTLISTVRARAQARLSEDGTEYTLSVKIPNDSEIDFDALHCVWSAAPVNIMAILIGSWRDPDTNVLYMTVNAIVRRARSPISGRFVMFQQMARRIRESRSVLYDARDGHKIRSLLLKSEETTAAATATDSGSDISADRTPWTVVKNKNDRDIVQSIVMMCKKMSPAATGSRFWSNIRVTENVAGRPDRLVVVWTMPANTIVDGLIGASLRTRHPESIEKIEFFLDPHSRNSKEWCPLVVKITLFSFACDIVRVTDAATLNIFSSMRNAREPNNTGIVKVAGPSQGATAETDPVTLATSTIAESRKRHQKRSRQEMELPPTPAAIGLPSYSATKRVGEDPDGDLERPSKLRRTRATFKSNWNVMTNILETLGLNQ